MKGWKTWVGAILIGGSSIVSSMFPEYIPIVNTLQSIGVALGLIGIGHKIEKGTQL